MSHTITTYPSTLRDLQRAGERWRDAAGRAYVAQRCGTYRRIERRETAEEIRAALTAIREDK